jgi:hypothetical protein
MQRFPTIIFTCLLLIGQPSRAVIVNGTEIPGAILLQGTDTKLVLNGAGVREKFFLDIYIGALYLEKPVHDPAAILADTGPASILMHFTYREVSREKIIAGWTDGLQENLPAKAMQAIQPRLERFNNLFRTVVKGEVIRIDYLPGHGTQVRINNELRGSIEGNEFFRDLLHVWLGPKPVSESLKRDMLGLD